MTHPDRGLLDTSVVILLDRLGDPSVLPGEPLISAITLAELSVGPLVASAARRHPPRASPGRRVELRTAPLRCCSGRAFGQVAAGLRRRGRKTSARSYDAMIAAIALANGLPLFTCNPRDFAGIDGLDVEAVAVPDPDE